MYSIHFVSDLIGNVLPLTVLGESTFWVGRCGWVSFYFYRGKLVKFRSWFLLYRFLILEYALSSTNNVIKG